MTSSPPNQPPSSYLAYLPAVLQEDEFIGKFLLAFEAILSGVSGSTVTGFEQKLTSIHQYFSATTTPEEFLPWLAGWVALSLRDDWEVTVKRDFIQQLIPLYRQRGTQVALKELLKIYLRKQMTTSASEYVEIIEFDEIPHYFQVQLRIDTQDLEEYRRKETIARAIIEQEKPAHTIYSLQILMPTMRLVSAEKLIDEETEKLMKEDKNLTKENAKKLAEKRLKAEDIAKRRLRLFASSKSSGYQDHRNRTALGTTNQRSQS